MNHALVLKSNIADCSVLRIRNQATVTSLGDSQTVDREAGCLSEPAVDFLGRRIGAHPDLLGERLNGFPYHVLENLEYPHTVD